MAGLKNLIAPFQKVLLNKRLCPGCTAPLDKMTKHAYDDASNMVVCNCRRMFIYDKESDSYRRATINEAEVFSNKS